MVCSPRILVVGLKQESSTFNPLKSSLSDFEIYRGDTAIASMRGTLTEFAGIINTADQCKLELKFGLIAWAPSGGIVDDHAWKTLSQEILTDLATTNYDGVIAVLHGSMVTEFNHDPDGWLLQSMRSIIGGKPLYATLDLHAVLTSQMLDAADLLVPYHTYPHTDHVQTGERATRLMARHMKTDIKPATAVVRIPLLVRGDELITTTGRFGQLIRKCIDAEKHPSGLSAGIFIGNPFTDVEDLASNVMVSMDGNPILARYLAESIADEFWADRKIFKAELTPLNEISNLITSDKVTLLSDQADATSSGATGDSISILRILCTHPNNLNAIVPVVDAPAVQRAIEIGEGCSGEFSLGGTIDDRNTSIQITAVVFRIFLNSKITYEDGTIGRCGDVAVLRLGDIEILVTTNAVWFVGRKIYESHGIDLSTKDVIVVKSPNGFRPHYEKLVDQIITVDGEGSTSANLSRLQYSRIRRPMSPLDNFEDPSLTARVWSSNS